GEQARNGETITGFEDAEGETGLGAAGAGDEFGNDGADQRKAAADPEASEKIRQRGRQLQVAQGLASRCAIEPEQRQRVATGPIEADRRIRDDGKKRDNPRANEQRQKRLPHPNDDQWRNRDDRRYLQDYRIRKEAEREDARKREQNRDPAAENG